MGKMKAFSPSRQPPVTATTKVKTNKKDNAIKSDAATLDSCIELSASLGWIPLYKILHNKSPPRVEQTLMEVIARERHWCNDTK